MLNGLAPGGVVVRDRQFRPTRARRLRGGSVASPIADSDKRARGAPPEGESSGPRRTGLVQERARRTRQALVNAALQLWTERGFEQGIEETTVDEIVQLAGVTKGTFYFHFAHKEDILLEVGWGTSEALFKDATKALADDRTIDEVLARLLTSLARRVSASPRAVVARTLAEFYRRPDRASTADTGREHYGFQRAYSVILFHAQETGQLPSEADARMLGDMLSSLTVGAIFAWITGQKSDLGAALRYCGEVLLGGVRAAHPS
jgi:AcrR family transcriptional regulator